MKRIRLPQTLDNAACQLAALPPELFDMVIFEIDSIRDLANFVITSRFVHQRFEAQKRAVLLAVLQNELGPVMSDADFLCVFRYIDPALVESERYYGRMHAMGAIYAVFLRDGGVHHERNETLVSPMSTLTKLCRTLHHVNFLANAYAAIQLRRFRVGIASGSTTETLATAPLSRTEWLRLVRAFYRRQILSNAWAATSRNVTPETEWTEDDVAAISNTSNHEGVPLGLFAPFESWELQHIDHADLFIARLSKALLHLSRMDDAAVPRIEKAEFGELFSHQDRLVLYMQTHPRLADTALGKLSAPGLPGGDQDSTRGQGYDHQSHDYHYAYCLPPLDSNWQTDREETFPDPVRDKLDQDGAAITFVGDDPDCVPFGWVDALDGRYTNKFGEALVGLPRQGPDNVGTERARIRTSFLWRYTGFSLWDRPRVEALKTLDWLQRARTGWIRRQGDGADLFLLRKQNEEQDWL